MSPAENQKAMRAIDLTGVGVLLAITAVVYILVVQPLLNRQSLIDEAKMRLDAQTLEAQQAALVLSEAQKRVVVAERAAGQNPLRLQPIERLNAWLALIADTAVQSDVELDQLEPGAAAQGEHYMTVPIRVVGRGDFVSSTRFLHRLREAMPDTAVESMELNGQPRSPEMPATFRLELRWHAAPQAQS